MKKLLALALALILALGCVGAFAEEAAPAYGIDTKMQLTLNHNLGSLLLGMTTGKYDEKLSEAVLNLLDCVYLDVASGGNVVDMALIGNEYPLTSVVGVADETGMTFVGDLFPHYALRMEYADIQAVMGQMSEQLNLQVNDEDVQMPELSDEEMAALMADLQTYAEDLDAFAASVQSSAVTSEDGSTVTITLTSQQLVGLAESVLNRLSADEVLKPYLEQIVEQVNARLSEEQKTSLEQVLATAAQKVQELKAAEDANLAVVTTSRQEDGSTYTEVNVANSLLVTVNKQEGALDVTALFSQKGITDAEAQLNGILDGTNAEDIAVQLSKRSETDENDVVSTTFTLDAMFGGLNLGVACSNAKTGEGTVDYVSHTIASLSLNLLGGELAQLEAITMVDDLPAAPELGERTVVNIINPSEEEKQALIKDVTTYGLPALAAACVQGMPDQVAALVELGMDMKNLSFQSDSLTQTDEYDYSESDESTDYSEDEEEEEYEDDGIDLSGIWTAPDGSVLTLNADGTFVLNYATRETQGTWYKVYNGGMMLDTERVGIYCDYTENSIEAVIGFDTLDFTR